MDGRFYAKLIFGLIASAALIYFYASCGKAERQE